MDKDQGYGDGRTPRPVVVAGDRRSTKWNSMDPPFYWRAHVEMIETIQDEVL